MNEYESKERKWPMWDIQGLKREKVIEKAKGLRGLGHMKFTVLPPHATSTRDAWNLPWDTGPCYLQDGYHWGNHPTSRCSHFLIYKIGMKTFQAQTYYETNVQSSVFDHKIPLLYSI